MSAGHCDLRMEVLREYASARKAVAPQEAEVAESGHSLAPWMNLSNSWRGRLDEVERHFGGGRFAPSPE